MLDLIWMQKGLKISKYFGIIHFLDLTVTTHGLEIKARAIFNLLQYYYLCAVYNHLHYLQAQCSPKNFVTSDGDMVINKKKQ